MDILRNESKTRYILNKIPIQTEAVLNFVITQGMKLDGSSYYSYTELGNLYILFPFCRFFFFYSYIQYSIHKK